MSGKSRSLKPPPRLPPSSPAQLRLQMPLTLHWQPCFYRVGENLSLHTSSPLGLPPDISIRIRPCTFMMGPSRFSRLSWKVPTSACEKPELGWKAKGSLLCEPSCPCGGLPMVPGWQECTGHFMEGAIAGQVEQSAPGRVWVARRAPGGEVGPR